LLSIPGEFKERIIIIIIIKVHSIGIGIEVCTFYSRAFTTLSPEYNYPIYDMIKELFHHWKKNCLRSLKILFRRCLNIWTILFLKNDRIWLVSDLLNFQKIFFGKKKFFLQLFLQALLLLKIYQIKKKKTFWDNIHFYIKLEKNLIFLFFYLFYFFYFYLISLLKIHILSITVHIHIYIYIYIYFFFLTTELFFIKKKKIIYIVVVEL